MRLELFHPVAARWFRDRFGAPTEPQAVAWPAIAGDRDTLVAAPTGSGKTLAAFFWCLDRLLRRGVAEGQLPDRTEVLYVSPLKALGNDVQRNLEEPLAEMRALALAEGLAPPAIRVAVRSGDTPAAERRRMAARPPHILVTTPESLFILLTSESGRRGLASVRTVIVDEIHAIAGDKRGAHLGLSLARLDRLVGQAGGARPVRIGLSATQKPIDEIARFLAGTDAPAPTIVDAGHGRRIDLAIEVPDDELSAVASNEMWAETYDRIAGLIRAHRTTIVFVNTRRLVERVAHQLEARLGSGAGGAGTGGPPPAVAAHHGSLSRKTRHEAERRLKYGELKAIVATASLELGIDVGAVDLVCQVGSPRAIRTLLQRVGRSGHRPGKAAADGAPVPAVLPKGRLFALTRDQLIECAALVRAARAGVLDRIEVRAHPLDVLAQQIVATSACEELGEDELFELCRRAYSYAKLERKSFDDVLAMLGEGFATRKGRSSAHIHRDLVNRVVRGRRGARIAAVTSGGAIPDVADYDVVAEPENTFVGKIDEDFAVESMAGDIFLLGNTSWQILRVEAGRVRVADAGGRSPTIPFWKAEAPSRTMELSEAVSDLRAEVERRLPSPDGSAAERLAGRAAAAAWLMEECAVPKGAAEQMVAYLAASQAMLGAIPTQRTIVAERFFDEAGGMQLVLHAPFGGRVNKAWGLALRKRFCRTFDFELQAAATDDGIILSLGPQHSFPLDSVFQYLHSNSVREVLEQAVIAAPMFGTRWRWNATRSLALLRFRSGKKVPAPLQRIRAEDLLTAVFPAVLMCPENHAGGNIQVPDHPLVSETFRDCLEEAMDLAGLQGILRRMEAGEVRLVARDTPEPSPMCHEILNANPYAFLDDAPLEERRARAVATRRGLPEEVAGTLGALDALAIETVVSEAWPSVRSPDELHDLLLTLGLVPAATVEPWLEHAGPLIAAGRVTWLARPGGRALVAAERLPLARRAFPEGACDPAIEPPRGICASAQPRAEQLFARGSSRMSAPADAEEATAAIVRAWLSLVGPVTASDLGARLAIEAERVDAALLRIEGEGQVLRGRFSPGLAEGATEWCDRGLLARIHRLTIGRLRREIEPVPTADFLRFLLRWQHVAPGTQLHGEEGLLRVIEQLQGFEISARSWESEILPARIAGYQAGWLDAVCLSGEIAWGKLAGRKGGKGLAVGRSAPITLARREDLPWLLEPLSPLVRESLSHAAQAVLDVLTARGASFLPEIVAGSRRLSSEVDPALCELVGAGVVTADGFQALRAILGRSRSQRHDRPWRVGARPRRSAQGRWSLLHAAGSTLEEPEVIERFARQLLRRYGVVFREVLAREPRAPAWRELLRVYRRLEARGEIRGGRFVAGPGGEHFALPEAVEALRAVRRTGAGTGGERVRTSAADPLNLAGIVTPGARIAAVPGNEVWFVDGVPIEAPAAALDEAEGSA